jgi:SAM-dependent methyltransferase
MVRELIETLHKWAHHETNARQRDLPPKAWLTPEEDALVPPRSLWIGPRDPISHYYRWIWEYLAYLTLLTDLRRQSIVLELGCGHGRIARGLLDYLRSPGAYYGIDVDATRLADADERFHKRYPNFHFIRADVYNRQYNPAGRIAGRAYVFPFENAAFDVIYAASLFSHLLPDETLGYFQQSARVLKPGGKCLFSCFVLDHYRGPGTAISPDYVFDHPLQCHEGVAVRFPEFPDVLIGYRQAVIERLAAEAGLYVLKVFPGLWTGSTEWAVNEQDLVLLSKG